jgi:hypothetical protein
MGIGGCGYFITTRQGGRTNTVGNTLNHLHRAGTKGVGTQHRAKAAEAATVSDAPADMVAKVRLAWDGRAVLRVNGTATEFSHNPHFRQRTVYVPLKKGRNDVSVLLWLKIDPTKPLDLNADAPRVT